MAGIVAKAFTAKDTKLHEGTQKPKRERNASSLIFSVSQKHESVNNCGMATTASFNSVVTARQVSHSVITAAMKIHSELGAGLLESAYKTCLALELRRSGLTCATEVRVPVEYCGIKLDAGCRLDLLVENMVVVEIKSVDAICPVHHAQVITYLKLSGKSLGLLINFNVVHLKDGIKRFVNGTGWR
jgi:GxxExxY protein